MYASNVLKILYSPRKTLKEVIQNPKYIGPLLIIILFVAASVGTAYVYDVRKYPQQFLPQGQNLDEWTQNSTFWNSNALVTESNDSITGAYYGNASIEFSIQNNTQVSMRLCNIGSINCTAPNGYDTLVFRVKLVNPVERPGNVSIQMFSSNSTEGYYGNLTDTFSNSTNGVWNNITLPLGTAIGWNSTGQSSDWSNITGLQLQFMWADRSNVTVLVDGLFFLGPYQSVIETSGTAYVVFSAASLGAMEFVITWFILSGILYVVVRAFGKKLVWKPLLIAVGFILITMFISTLIAAIGYLAYPTFRIPFTILGGVPGEGSADAKAILNQTSLVDGITLIIQYIILVWTAALAALVIHLTTEFSWAKSALVGALSYLIALFVANIILFI